MPVFTCSYESENIGFTACVTVILPQSKHVLNGDSPQVHLKSVRASYPVLLFLHDEAESPRELIEMTNIVRYADQAGIAVVLPQGMRGYWCDYEIRDKMSDVDPDPFDSFIDLRYEQFLMKELLPYLEHILPLRVTGTRSWIAGTGMGGFGALKIGLKYSEAFEAIGTLSGNVDPIRIRKECKDREPQFYAIWGSEPMEETENDIMYQIQKACTSGTISPIFLSWSEHEEFSELNQDFSIKLNELGVLCHRLPLKSKQKWEIRDQQLNQFIQWIYNEVKKTS